MVAYSRWALRAIDEQALADEVPSLASKLFVSPVVSRLLWLRGIRTVDAGKRFLQPQLRDLRPPNALPDMERASTRLAAAVRAGERIAICGDYDVDGMTGTALLVRFFQLVEANTTWAIPDRNEDGYGLSAGMVDRLAADGVQVIVTVDNGMRAYEALAAAARHGIDVVITDHHLPGEQPPQAVAVVNPHLGTDGDDQPLCGCALGFKLAWAVADRLRTDRDSARSKLFKSFLRDALGLVALATLADMVPLVEENRILVSGGLASLRASDHPGIRSLCDIAKLGTGRITSEDVAFKLAPRLNAAGRLSKPELVVHLLTEMDPDRCRALAHELDQANTERRKIELGVREEALAQAETLIAAETEPGRSIVVAGKDWHLGVIGIVAARLVDQYHRPAVVIGSDGVRGRGSCRTPRGTDLNQALQDSAHTLVRCGGHAMAAGLEIADEQIGDFREAFEAAVRTQQEKTGPPPTLELDAESDPDDWTLETVRSIRRMEPFGAENPEPSFLIRNAQIAGRPKLIGANSAHLAFTIKQSKGAIRVMAWGRADLYDLVAGGTPLEIAATPVENTWRGTTTPELRLIDARAMPTEA